MSTVLFSFTGQGGLLAEQICAVLPNAVHCNDFKHNALKAQVQHAFENAESLLFIGAAGIAVRAIAPYIRTKATDPAVLVADERGQYFIPILSGHLGGANELAQRLAAALQGKAILTTATDVNGCFAVDLWAKENHLAVLNTGGIKYISAALLRGAPVSFFSCCPVKGPLPALLKELPADGLTPAISIVEAPPAAPLPNTLYLLPKQYALGVGCKRATPEAVLEEAVSGTLPAHGIPIEALRAIGSIDLKAKEPALLALAKRHRLALYFYTAEALAAAAGRFSSSAFVKQTTGVDNVCERSASLLTEGGEPVLQKTVKNGVTLAVYKYSLNLRFKG